MSVLFLVACVLVVLLIWYLLSNITTTPTQQPIEYVKQCNIMIQQGYKTGVIKSLSIKIEPHENNTVTIDIIDKKLNDILSKLEGKTVVLNGETPINPKTSIKTKDNLHKGLFKNLLSSIGICKGQKYTVGASFDNPGFTLE